MDKEESQKGRGAWHRARELWRQARWGLAREVTIVALTSLATLAVVTYQSRLSTFNYVIRKTGAVIQRPELGTKDLKIMIDGQPVENVSTVTVWVFNSSSTDFEDVPIVMTARGPSTPKLISSKVSLPPEAYSTEKLDSGDERNSLRLRHTLKVANRSDSPIYQVDYFFEGSQPPDLSAYMGKKGIEAKQVEENKATPTVGLSWPTRIMLYILIGVCAGCVAGLIIIRERVARYKKTLKVRGFY